MPDYLLPIIITGVFNLLALGVVWVGLWLGNRWVDKFWEDARKP